MTEEELSIEVKKLSKLYGWRMHHCRAARTQKGWRTPIEGDPGFPDWILLRENADRSAKLLIVELKSENGILSLAQKQWLDLLNRVPGVEVYTWRPKDLEQIEKCLR